MPEAAGLAAALKEALGVKAKLHEGSGGVFDVALDGEVIFSKAAAGRFPEHEEVIAKIKSRS